jgi:multiple sugar transport system ATP-binding protein
MASIVFDHVSKVYSDGTRAVDDLSLEVHDGEFMVFVGPSGCGKTTALRMLAGLEEVTEGEIRIGERVVSDLQPGDRDIAMVFQNYALYPHMTVANNMAFGLKMKGKPKDERSRRVGQAARILGITDILDRKPAALSGGQRQRVAMGRAIVREPQAFLMDEPLSNLDAKLRVQTRTEIARIQREVGATTIYVTHDQVEAMTMATRVAVLRGGRLQQLDAPQRLYDEPANLFVAGFIGSPAMNLLEAQLDRDDAGICCWIAGQRLEIPAETVRSRPALEGYVGRTVAVGLRPEDLHAGASGPAVQQPQRLQGRVRITEALGSDLLVHAEIDAQPVVTTEVLEIVGDVDSSLVDALTAQSSQRHSVILARFPARARVAIGDQVEVFFDPSRLQFFDLETSEGIYAARVAVPAGAATA